MEYAIFSLLLIKKKWDLGLPIVFLMHHRSVHSCGILSAMSAPCDSPARIKKADAQK
jgi:hypothetical protein